LRPACSSDIWAIRKLVLSAKLDPTQLRWSQFWVIECEGRVVACGQLRSFAGAQELGSLVVESAWRGQGLGRCLVKHLIREATEVASWHSFILALGLCPFLGKSYPNP
jgi:amino-acid N-acetyltransferase